MGVKPRPHACGLAGRPPRLGHHRGGSDHRQPPRSILLPSRGDPQALNSLANRVRLAAPLAPRPPPGRHQGRAHRADRLHRRRDPSRHHWPEGGPGWMRELDDNRLGMHPGGSLSCAIVPGGGSALARASRATREAPQGHRQAHFYAWPVALEQSRRPTAPIDAEWLSARKHWTERMEVPARVAISAWGRPRLFSHRTSIFSWTRVRVVEAAVADGVEVFGAEGERGHGWLLAADVVSYDIVVGGPASVGSPARISRDEFNPEYYDGQRIRTAIPWPWPPAGCVSRWAAWGRPWPSRRWRR